MSWNFEKFENVEKEVFKCPSITLHANNTLSLSRAAVDEFEFSKYKDVMLYYDKDKRAIGIKRLDKPMKGSSPVLTCHVTTRIRCSAFVKMLKITETIRIKLVEDSDAGCLVALLPKPGKCRKCKCYIKDLNIHECD
jgi:hypothetical protein